MENGLQVLQDYNIYAGERIMKIKITLIAMILILVSIAYVYAINEEVLVPIDNYKNCRGLSWPWIYEHGYGVGLKMPMTKEICDLNDTEIL